MRPGDELELQPFDCPRCGTPVQERFWGPCRSCRVELSTAHPATQSGRSEHTMPSGRFEPTMHVVPNHVATKD